MSRRTLLGTAASLAGARYGDMLSQRFGRPVMIRDGGDPAGVSFDGNVPPVRFSAGNFLID